VNKKYKQKRGLMSEINVVPYIDVMLVLLVIFMIATPLLTQGVDVNLPQANAKPIVKEQKDPIIVSVDANGLYYLNIAQNPGEPISAIDLANQVATQLQLDQQQNQKQSVLVKGDGAVNYGKVIEAMALLQQAGVSDIGLVTKQPDKSTNDVS
jgi:biopolymer transport protein TolR